MLSNVPFCLSLYIWPLYHTLANAIDMSKKHILVYFKHALFKKLWSCLQRITVSKIFQKCFRVALQCDKEPVLLSPIVLIPFLSKSPFETLWYKQFPSPKNWTGSYRVLSVPSKKMFWVWCTCSYLLLLQVKHVFHVSTRQNQVNFLVCQKEAKKIGLVGRQKKNIVWFLGSVFLKKYFA